jgi:hypothetical protein
MGRARTLRFITLLTMLSAATVELASAQELPILAQEHTQLITQEVSGDAAYEHIRHMTQFHRPRGGSDGLWEVAEYMERTARASGLADVQLIKQASTTRPWNAKFADLWIVEPEPERIASTLQSVLHLADYSRPADVSGELVDVGAGGSEDFEGMELSGKIVLTHGSASTAMRAAVCERGAGLSRPDQLRWLTVPSRASNDCEPTFAFNLSTRQGVALRNRLRRAQEPVVVRAVVDAAFDSEQGTEPWQVMVEAFIRGTEPELGQDIVLTGHLQEEGFSANDDASGSASTLEVARALNRLINDGRLPRPRRNVRFWWVTEIGSQRQYFADNPQAHESIWVNVNQDMVGADQSQDIMRKQNITRVPAARFHFFNDVVESVIDYMVAANTYELAQAQAGNPLYPKGHLAHLGSMHRYNADMIFFHTSSDHMPFLEAPIGIPAVSFTNMPDRFIHSSDDDLWNIDRTQLGRNAAAVALIAYAMANADAGDVPALAAATVGRGVERMGRNLGLGLSWIAGADDKAAAYHDAVDQVQYAANRERVALTSLREIHPSAAGYADQLIQEVERREVQALREVDLAYRHASGERRMPSRQLTEVEQQLAQLMPELIAGPSEFRTGRGQVRFVPGLHGLMRFEIMNAVNGERTGLDIHRYVAAEAREAGSHYFGVVTAEGVLRYLESVANAELIRLQ